MKNPAAIRPAAPTAWLELPDGGQFRLQGRSTIGRQPDNDLVFATTALSRHHAMFTPGEAGFMLTDLRSSNGTYVNRELIDHPRPLLDGDEIRIGDLVLRYRCLRPENTAPAPVPSIGATQVVSLVRQRLCWLLVTDIIGFSTLNEHVGSERALDQLQHWIQGVRPLLEGNGACINGYLGDAIFAYWACDLAKPSAVLATLRGLEAYRPSSPVPFRMVVHQGTALFTKGPKGEELTGQEVNLVFRAEKVAKRFQVTAMLSEQAVESLEVAGRCSFLGESAVDGMSGLYRFYAPPADLLAAGP
ncbi:MAG TPA: FHA domain-containing protein [Lacunisphaera sp.]|nr:FHA domain-containing protein [Lacunisphaera sp.]